MCMDMYRASSGVEVDLVSSGQEVDVVSSGVEVNMASSRVEVNVASIVGWKSGNSNTAVCVTLATVALSVTKWKDRPATFVTVHGKRGIFTM